MAVTRIVLNKKNVKSLLKSQEMLNICKERAEAIKEAAGGEGYVVDTHVGKTRVNASVRANTIETIKDNYKNNTLLKSLR